MGKHIIINVGRQIGSGGRIIAARLAETFGCKLYDKEILNLAARESGFCEKFFEQNDEKESYLKSLFHAHLPFLSDATFYKPAFSQENLYKFQSDAIRKAAAEGNCVFVGRTADYVLRDHKECIDLFITASMEARIKAVCRRRGCDRATATKYITKGEEERAGYYNFFTGKTWGAATSYDFCIDSSILGIDATADVLADYIRRRLALSDGASQEGGKE